MNYPRRRSALIGGRRVDLLNYKSKIELRAKALIEADRPKRKRQLAKGEENQLLLFPPNRK